MEKQTLISVSFCCFTQDSNYKENLIKLTLGEALDHQSLDKGRSYLTVPPDCIQEQNTGNTKEENLDAIAKRR